MKINTIAFLLIVTGHIIYGNNNYGLFIKAYPSGDSEKTSLVLENNHPIRLHNETTISFDLYVRRENVFGMVLRAVTDGNENIDFIFTVGEDGKRYPMLVIKESVYLITEEIQCEKWLPVRLTFSKGNDRISIDYNGAKVTKKHSFPTETGSVHISFGLCPFDNFVLHDIASVNIRNVKIYEGDRMKRFWKLDKHNGNISYDSIASVPAIATNPQWITDLYSTWKQVYSGNVQEKSLFAYNQVDNLIYIVAPDSKSIQIIDPDTETSETIEVKNGIISSFNASNQIFFDHTAKELVTYNLNQNITSRFSFKTRSWSSQTKPTTDNSYINNSVSFSHKDSTFISFGGYGFYKYNNEIIRLDHEGKIIKKSRLPEISPRYAASTAVVNHTLYILGGRGNKSGRQELSPKNAYDFYSVDLLTEQVNKLWEDETIHIDFLPGENMIFDTDENCFYTYTTNQGGMLTRIYPDKKGFEQVSFPINEDLQYHYLHTNLYFSPVKKRFYALVHKTNPDKASMVNIYALHYPPRPISGSAEIQPAPKTGSFPYLLIIPVVIAVIAIAGFVAIRLRRNRKRTRHTPSERQKPVATIISDAEDVACYDFSKSSVCLLGGFYVCDRSGKNITGQFTPMLKQLLVLLILYTTKDPKGIPGNKLIQLLWYDKNEDSAKNNRNVYISKLRSALEAVGNIEIINKNGFWTISFNDVGCDYLETMRLFSKIKETAPSINADEVNRLLRLLLRGVLLPHTEVDWSDRFKNDFSNLTIDALKQLIRNESYRLSNDLKLKIADTIFLHDYINEDALYLKCSILYNSGKKGIAKIVYDNFVREYSASLGIRYKYTLQDVIRRKNIEETTFH
ncbi:MAG: hypothetical protein LBH77_08590 [Tannerella sp.]|jgi:two-component SAPR family response regulator|nr:hypothetical protein [Tannerella sp.]